MCHTCLKMLGRKHPPVRSDMNWNSSLIVSKVYIAERTGIAMFVKEINKVIPENMQPLAASKVTQWLVLVGYLVEQQSSDGHKYKVPTELGTSIGMTSAWRDGSQGQYLAVSYDANAQHFILENLFKL